MVKPCESTEFVVMQRMSSLNEVGNNGKR